MNEKSESQKIFEDYPVSKSLALMAIPTILGQLIVLIYNLADTFYIGRVNNPYMVAAAALILPVFNISLAIAGLAGVGGGSLISRLLGAGKREDTKKVSSFSIYLGIMIALLFSLCIGLCMNPFLKLLGAGKDTIKYARDYALCVIVLGGIPTVLSNTLANLIRSVGYSKKAGFGVTMGGVLNIIIDPLFMFVLFPSGMEITAAGSATCLSNCISCLYFIYTIYHLEDSVITFSIKVGLPEKKSIQSIFGVGVPSSTATLLFDLDYMVINRLMSGYGDIALAAIGIVLKAERLPLNIGIGICQGMNPIVAYNYSAKNYKRMKKTIFTAGLTGMIASALSVTMYILFASNIMKIFIENIETVTLGSSFLRLRALATPFMFLSFFTLHIFNSFGKGKTGLLLGVTRWAVFNIPMLVILNHFIGMYGIVSSQVCGDILNVIFSMVILFSFLKTLPKTS